MKYLRRILLTLVVFPAAVVLGVIALAASLGFIKDVTVRIWKGQLDKGGFSEEPIIGSMIDMFFGDDQIDFGKSSDPRSGS